MTDDEIEAENAEAGDCEWCGVCREYVPPEQAEEHARFHDYTYAERQS